jgi:hypothetical protein
MLRKLLPTALAASALAGAAPPAQAGGRLTLKSDAAGWVLADPQGEVVFRAPGTDGKRACLRYALSRGAVRVS